MVAQLTWFLNGTTISIYISLSLITPSSMTLWSNLAGCNHSLSRTSGNFPSNYEVRHYLYAVWINSKAPRKHKTKILNPHWTSRAKTWLKYQKLTKHNKENPATNKVLVLTGSVIHPAFFEEIPATNSKTLVRTSNGAWYSLYLVTFSLTIIYSSILHVQIDFYLTAVFLWKLNL